MADYASLQKLALSDKGQDEAVTVNQRALIDKILARYASDNTTLRELLQNADDANATSVKIHYLTLSETTVPLEALATTPCKRLQVSNNGVPFRPEDWTRLKRIAEGNPDTEKIGAFGVGFYSVFSICDDPFVSSGKECMTFYWNDKDQLFVRRRVLDNEEDKTTFMLNMRTPTEIPNLPDLCRFLATSLTFTRSLSSIELHFDDYILLSLHRQAAPDSSIPLQPSPISLISPKRSMQLTSASLQPVQIKATYMNITQSLPTSQPTGFKKLFAKFSTTIQPPSHPPNPASTTTAIAFLRIATVHLKISIGPKFAIEFERAQKKPPPTTTKISLLCVNKAEFDASNANDPVFAELIPVRQGRVYIGFPTHQTTGFKGHVGAPALVPTVERESIDLADPQLRVWNGELLGCVGIFARVLYNLEMESLGKRFKKDDDIFITEAIHLLQSFTFHATTPSNKVRQYIEETFFSCVKDGQLPLLTNHGVRSSQVVRIAPREMPFLVTTSLLPETIALGAEQFVSRLREVEILKEVTWEDVKNELNSRTLTETHAIQLLRWLTKEHLPFDQQKQLLSTAVVIVGDEKFGKIVNLGEITAFVVPGKIPVDGGLPSTVLPLEIGKSFSHRELESFGWPELSVHNWIKHICNTTPAAPRFDVEKSPDFAVAVLTTASKQWDSMPHEERLNIISMLSSKKCMPTVKKGLLKPGETYFHNVKVLPDLPLIESMKGVKERFLEQLGVRRVVALQLIFDRLGEGGDWSHIDGIKYLASVQHNLTPDEFQKLRAYPLCPSRSDKKRMVVNQLYEPKRELEKLDLPILSWPPEAWRPTSAEASFLYTLGLNRCPSALTLIQMAARSTNTPDQRNHILDFFTTFYHTHGYHQTNISKVTEPFLPSEPVNGKIDICRPSEIYSNPACKVLGFNILAHRFIPDASKLGVSPDPSPQALERALTKSPPSTPAEAREKFAYAAQRITTLTKPQLTTLSRAKIVPVTRRGVTKHVPPYLCFIDTHEQKERIWEDIFDFVDFGDRANLFLEALGVRDRPDPSQIADQLAREPMRIFRAMDISGYLRLLSTLGTNAATLQRDRHLWQRLRDAPCLIGLTTVTDDRAEEKASATMARAQDIVIVDEPRLGVIFRSDLIVAPERDDCEALYIALGSPHLSSLVKQKHRARGPPVTNSATEALRKHVIERAGIFLTLPEVAPHVNKSVSYLTENLRIHSHQSIVVERNLLFGRVRASNIENVTAVMDTSGKGYLLLVTDPDKVSFNQIAEALNSIILKKSNRGTDLMFETILKENLEFLRFRGFAVDRLLNRHLEEQRLAKAKKDAEEAERRKEERLRIEKEREIQEQERHEAIKQAEETIRAHAPTMNGVATNGTVANGHVNEKIKERPLPPSSLPGAWQDPESQGPPPPYPSPPQASRPLGGFVNSIKNALRLPDPLLPQQPIIPQTMPEVRPTPHYPTSKASIDNQLAKAVQASRPSDSTSIFHPATSTMVHEAPQSYCDSTGAHDLQLYNHAPKWGMKTFYVTGLRPEFDMMIGSKEREVTMFAELLKRLAEVYRVRPDSFHLFFDSRGKTIAFNGQGSLFFNIGYFLEYHVKQSGGYTKDAPAYWFTVIAHELAHNMVHQHGAEHSYWTEAFVSSYMLVLWDHFG